jgi:hypothetical protein
MYMPIVKRKMITSFTCFMLMFVISWMMNFNKDYLPYYMIFFVLPIVFIYGGSVSFLSDYIVIKKSYPYILGSLCLHMIGGSISPVILALIFKPSSLLSNHFYPFPSLIMLGAISSFAYWAIDMIIRYISKK